MNQMVNVETAERRPLVSVVVIGRNEGERLAECLRAVRDLEFPAADMEVIYVDSHSTDDSVARARDAGVRVVVLPPGPTTAARGRNAGFEIARGDFILFLDGDAMVAPGFLAHALEFFRAHPEVAVYWGHRRERYPHHSVYNRVLDLDWLFPTGESSYCGGDALVRTRVLRQVGPFREDLIAGEEPELCTRIRKAGHHIWHADELMTLHDLAIGSFRAYWRRAYRSGHAYAEVADVTRGALFQREAVKNHVQTVAYLLGPPAIIAAFGWRGVWAIAALVCVVLLRTVWRNRWRRASISTTLLYAVHAHLCQIPIWFGQLAFRLNRYRQNTPRLIEYK